jgi:hypothetical protein
MRQRYKKGLIEQGSQEVIQAMVNKSVLDAFTGTDPRIVELRRKMFRQDGLLPQEGQATMPGTRQPSRYPVDDIEQQTLYTLQMPFGRAEKKEVA